MLEKNKDISFEVDCNVSGKTLSVYQDILVEWKDNGLYCSNGGGGYSIYLNQSYICLDADIETKRIQNFGGMCLNQKLKDLAIPTEFVVGILKLKKEPSNFSVGIGTRIKFDKNIFYDKDKKILQFGDLKSNIKTYKVFKNMYVQLNDINQITAIVISDIEMKILN